MVSESTVLNEERKNIKWKRPKVKKQTMADVECARCGMYYPHTHDFFVMSVPDDIQQQFTLADCFYLCRKCCKRDDSQVAEQVFFSHLRQLLAFAQPIKEQICSRCGKSDRSPECRTEKKVFFQHAK